jgi:hypothetical protein
MGLLGAALAVTSGNAHAQILDLVYERTVMAAADERCGLFTPEISAALAAAQAQAHGAALRSGATLERLRTLEERARESGFALECGSPDVAAAAARVRSAFAAFARLQRVNYPGEVAGWRADRTGPGAIRWRLAQETRFGSDRMTFGLAGRGAPGSLIAVGQFADGETPYAARLLMRNADRNSGPYFDRLNSSAGALPLERRLPPRGGLRIFTAEARSPAGLDLLPKGARGGWAFRFPSAAAQGLGGLDPREAVAVEFLFPGDVVRRAYVEVGDFPAGEAFLKVAQR